MPQAATHRPGSDRRNGAVFETGPAQFRTSAVAEGGRFRNGPRGRRHRSCQNWDVGVVLTPIVRSEAISLEALRGQTLAVDGHGELYQFLALIRLRDGTPLMDST